MGSTIKMIPKDGSALVGTIRSKMRELPLHVIKSLSDSMFGPSQLHNLTQEHNRAQEHNRTQEHNLTQEHSEVEAGQRYMVCCGSATIALRLFSCVSHCICLFRITVYFFLLLYVVCTLTVLYLRKYTDCRSPIVSLFMSSALHSVSTAAFVPNVLLHRIRLIATLRYDVFNFLLY